MAEAELKARPIFRRTRDFSEAHLTLVFAAIVVARHLQNHPGTSETETIHTLQLLRTIVVTVRELELVAVPAIDDANQDLIHAINERQWKSGLNATIHAFIEGWNTRSHPFVWTKTADEVAVKDNRNKLLVRTISTRLP